MVTGGTLVEVVLDHRAGCTSASFVNDAVRGAYCPSCRAAAMPSDRSPSRNRRTGVAPGVGHRAEKATGLPPAGRRPTRRRRPSLEAVRRVERAFGVDAAIRFALKQRA
jgi:hypothetical protein